MKIIFGTIFILSVCCSSFAQNFWFKGRVLCSDDDAPINNCPVIFKTDKGVLMQYKTDSLGYYAINYKIKGKEKIEIYTQTDKTVTTPTARFGFLAGDDRANYEISDSTKETTFIKDFRLQMVRACGYVPTIRYKRQSLVWDTIGGAMDSEFDSSNYFPKSAIFGLFKLLLKNPTIIIELSGHCSSEEFNTMEADAFSQMRAEVVKLELMKYGISGERIKVKGWGERKLKITDVMIAKQTTEEEKEELHSINRRVVFKILSWEYPDAKSREVEIPIYNSPKVETEK